MDLEVPEKNCGATAISTNQEHLVEKKKHHGHLPDTALVEVRKRVSEAISAAESNRDTPVSSIVDLAFNGLVGETLVTMPAMNTLRACLTRHRNKDVGAVNRGEKSEEWPEKMKETRDGRTFLHFDSADDNLVFGLPLQPGFIGPAPPPRVLVFTTTNLLRLLQINRHWAMDGTFYAVPKWYKQMYVVGFNAANLNGTSSFFPCVYLLLQSKKEDAYLEGFSKVFCYFSADHHPISLMMDFETAAKNAFLRLFPDVSVKHCLFHLFQSLYKLVQKEKMKSLWAILDVKIVLRCLPGLAFLPIQKVEDGFDQLLAAKDDLISSEIIPSDSINHLNKIFSYFERNYIRRTNGNAALYKATLWNMHERALAGLPRTNNGVENWNGQFNRYFNHDNPSLADVILKLQADEEKSSPQSVGAHDRWNEVEKAIYSADQIKQLVTNYVDGGGQLRMEFLVSIGAHLEKYQSN